MDLFDTLVANIDNIYNTRKFLFTIDGYRVFLSDAFDCVYSNTEAAFADIDTDSGERVIYVNDLMLKSDALYGTLWHEAGHHHYGHGEDMFESLRNWKTLSHEEKRDILIKGLFSEVNYDNEMQADGYAAKYGYAEVLVKFLEKQFSTILSQYENGDENIKASLEPHITGIRNRIAALRVAAAA